MAPNMFRSIVVLCSFLTSALCCDWLTHYSNLRNSSIVLIETMGGPFTDQRSPLTFPYRLYDQTMRKEVNIQLLFIRDSLQQIYDLYQYNDVSPAAWDSVKTTDFLESVHRQIKELDVCVESTERRRPNKQLRSYCKKLKKQTLVTYAGSRDGWELLRKETSKHLRRLDLLGNHAASRGQHAAARHQ